MFTRPARLALAAAVACSVAGCASRVNAPKAHQNPSAASAIGADDGREFEKRRDPAIRSETRYAAGELAETRGAYAQAAAQYREALKQDPNHLPSLYRLGVVLAQLRNYPDAIATWKRYLQATRDSAAGYSNLGFCYELASRPDEAEAAYQKGIRKDPRHVACRVNYGLMLIRRGREGEGRQQLQAVLKPAEVHYNVGSAYESLGRAEQARLEYRRALELDPGFSDAQVRLSEMQRPAPATKGSSRAEPTAPASADVPVGEIETTR
jgi:tetratricopeptide (TPR) repeat protein